MEDYIKRVNLSFDIRRDTDRRVYEILASKPQKTAYIKETILSNEEEKYEICNRKTLKTVIREILTEMKFHIDTNKNIMEDEIPKEVFDVFDQM